MRLLRAISGHTALPSQGEDLLTLPVWLAYFGALIPRWGSRLSVSGLLTIKLGEIRLMSRSSIPSIQEKAEFNTDFLTHPSR
jgi:hypothetical protein